MIPILAAALLWGCGSGKGRPQPAVSATSAPGGATLRSAGGKSAQVYLSAPDEQIQVVDAPSCLAQPGDTLRTGHYRFFLRPEGAAEPVEQPAAPYGNQPLTLNDHRPQYLTVLRGGSGVPDLLLVMQYGSCNGDALAVLALSPDGQHLIQYRFRPANGQTTETIATRGVENPRPGVIRTPFYNNASGQTTITTWEIRPAESELVATATEHRQGVRPAVPSPSGA